MDLSPLTEDALLGGRVRLFQPATGYRVSTDAVLLAAAVPASAGESVLELGTGGGGALLCLAARVPGLTLAGLERETEWCRLAARNAALNGLAIEVIEGDLAAPPPALKARAFDHVMMNPPYFACTGLVSPDRLRDRARREETPLSDWVGAALARLRPGGWLTAIQRAERLADLLTALGDRAGSVAIRPLAARTGRDAKRVMLAARKGARGPLRLAAPLVLHEGAVHAADRDDFTPEAAAILRDGAALPL